MQVPRKFAFEQQSRQHLKIRGQQRATMYRYSHGIFCMHDQCCGSRILIFIHPGSRIKQQHQKRGKFYFCPTIFCSHKYHEIVNNFIFEQVKKTFLAKTLRIIVLFTQKFVNKLSKIRVWDPGFGNTYSGSRVKKAPDT
jgi:hypothetical protein